MAVGATRAVLDPPWRTLLVAVAARQRSGGPADERSGEMWQRFIVKVGDKLRYGRRTSPAYYWAHAPLLWIRRPRPGAAARRVSDDLRARAATITSIDELGLANKDAFWAEVDALVERLEPVTVGPLSGDLLDGRNTQAHCISIDPPELAEVAPEVLMAGLDDNVLDAVEQYLGVPVAFCGVHLRKDIGNSAQVGTRIWHLDTEDHRTVRMIIYLNDVTVDDGPFEYIPLDISQSMPDEIKERGLRAKDDPLLDDEMARLVPVEQWCQATGPRGTIALADNARLFHHGKAHDSLRLAIFYTFTSRSPRYPRIRRNHRLDARLTPRQQRAFYVDTVTA